MWSWAIVCPVWPIRSEFDNLFPSRWVRKCHEERDTRHRTRHFHLSMSRHLQTCMSTRRVSVQWWHNSFLYLRVCFWRSGERATVQHRYQQSMIKNAIFSQLNLRHIRWAYVRLTGLKEVFFYLRYVDQKDPQLVPNLWRLHAAFNTNLNIILPSTPASCVTFVWGVSI
jgi:uncharacterized integral membrane protein